MRWSAGVLGAVAIAGTLASGVVPKTAGAEGRAHSRHVLLISVDGLHQYDLATCEANGTCPHLAALAGMGTTYTNAVTSEPSDSAPGLMALVTGGDPKLTGVYYDDAYDRTMYTPPAQTKTGTQDCSGPAGSETQLFENVDNGAPTFSNPNGYRPVVGDTIDPAQLPYQIQNGKCTPVLPNDFLRTNSIFSVASAAGLRTAWADKHPVYNEEIAGHGTPNAVTDPFNTEINADVIPAQLTDTRGNVVTFPRPNPTGDPNGPFITDSVGNTEGYDQIKVDAILNEIDGLNSQGTLRVGTPAIFGMNFQTVSVAQKLVDATKCQPNTKPAPCGPSYYPGGYNPDLTFTPQMTGAVQWVDNALQSMVAELQKTGQLDSTTIIISAKHGQSPIDPSKLAKIGHAETDVLSAAGITPQQVTDDDIALIWFQNDSQTPAAVNALEADQKGANTARIQYILSGGQLASQFNSPTVDPRTPSIIVQPIPGTIYSHSAAKVAEHGGFSVDDTHVALLVVNGGDLDRHHGGRGQTVTAPVRTYQVAPTILKDLGLNPHQLDAVRVEGVQVLPGS
jgi:Type I phosphodiesterase / nucleotide pyrophosphatase